MLASVTFALLSVSSSSVVSPARRLHALVVEGAGDEHQQPQLR